MLATRRPEPDPGVGELEAELAADPARRFRALQLAPIPKSAERALARSLLGGEVGDEVLEVVCDGVDGNPLFLEERLASLLDTGALDRDGAGWRLGTSDAAPRPRGARAAGPLPCRPAQPGVPGGGRGRLGAGRGRSSARRSGR